MLSGWWFLLGVCVGSFLNCLVYRLNQGLSPFKGRSLCPKCHKQLKWRDNIPIVSFLWLMGRCRHCRTPISWQYPLVEFGAGVLTLVVVNYFFFNLEAGWLATFYHLLLVWGLLAIFVSDLRYMIVLDEVVVPLILLAFLYSLVILADWQFILAGLGAGLFFGALVLLTRGKGMGLGDVKLGVLMGLSLGYPKIVVALYLAFLTGALVGVILILLKKKRLGEQIPFGPFLVAATLISLFWGEIIWRQSLVLV